jgi:hypothetical protein
MTNSRHGDDSQLANFAQRLNKAMQKAKINNKTLAEHIDLENTLGEGISDRTIVRWRRGEKNKKGELYQPKERDYILDMIKPLGFSRREQEGLKECNQLLQAAKFWPLDEQEQKKYFPRLKFKPLHEPPPFPCFAYDKCWTGREELITTLTTKALENYRLFVLVGLTGIGKTALAEKLAAEWLDNEKQFDRINFDDQEKNTDFASIAAELLIRWGNVVTPDSRKDVKQLLSQLLKQLRNNCYILLIDSLEYILKGDEKEGWHDFEDEWWAKFFQSLLAGEQCQSLIILTSQDLPTQIEKSASRYQNFFFCQPLTGLKETEQLALFEKTGLKIHDNPEARNYLTRIGRTYEGHPLALRVIAGEIISSPFEGDILAYWNQYRHDIEVVEKALEEAKTKGMTHSLEDKFTLHNYTRQLRTHLRTRLEKTFLRLKKEAHPAYLLLCEAAIYRCAVPEAFWLSHLEDWEYNEEQQKMALDTLQERYLVETEIDPAHQLLLRQHNLIRSVALECLAKMEDEL